MSFILRHDNDHKETHYFVRFGRTHITGQRLIDHVTEDATRAHRFDTAPEAAQALAESGNHAGWQIVEISEI